MLGKSACAAVSTHRYIYQSVLSALQVAVIWRDGDGGGGGVLILNIKWWPVFIESEKSIVMPEDF